MSCDDIDEDCIACAEGKCLECLDSNLQADGTCIDDFDDCEVGPEFYVTTQDLKLACPLCKDNKTFSLED